MYQPGFSEEDYDRLKETVRRVAKRHGRFTANDALFDVLQIRVTNNAGDVAAILGDLTDLGYLRQIPDTDPPQWELRTS